MTKGHIKTESSISSSSHTPFDVFIWSMISAFKILNSNSKNLLSQNTTITLLSSDKKIDAKFKTCCSFLLLTKKLSPNSFLAFQNCPPGHISMTFFSCWQVTAQSHSHSSAQNCYTEATHFR